LRVSPAAEGETMSELFWEHARKCPACQSHKYAMLDADGLPVMECKACGHRRPLRCPTCQGETFDIREKLDSLKRPFRRPFCRTCGGSNTSWNLRLSVSS
jgi:Zn ribbon nucleic-acid-binding protein